MIKNAFSSVKENEPYLDYEKWLSLALDRYGRLDSVKFRCPKCGHVAEPNDYMVLGRYQSAAGIVCIGYYIDVDKRFTGGPCRYNSLSELNENPILVKIANQVFIRLFDFADNPIGSAGKCLETSDQLSTDAQKNT